MLITQARPRREDQKLRRIHFVPVGKFYGEDTQILQRIENADTYMILIEPSVNGLLGSLTVGQQHLGCLCLGHYSLLTTAI